jgi:hypothetical protein
MAGSEALQTDTVLLQHIQHNYFYYTSKSGNSSMTVLYDATSTAQLLHVYCYAEVSKANTGPSVHVTSYTHSTQHELTQ